MNSHQENLVLFCGGETKLMPGKLPKPLIELDKKAILLHYLDQIPTNLFLKVILLVEEHWLSEFKHLIAHHKGVEIYPVSNSSSTLIKLNEYLANYSNHTDFTTFSYPDIFVEKSYWNNATRIKDRVLLIQKPLSSRFPRIFSSPFNNKVKGISDYHSKVPANPHFIFAGKFFSETRFLKKYLNNFISKTSKEMNLEVDFFDWLACEEVLICETYIDEWIISDSPKDNYSILQFINQEKI